MQKSLLTLVIAVTLVLGSMMATFAAQPVLKDRNSLTVVDAHGVKVGDLFGFSAITFGWVAFEVDRRPFVLRVTSQGLTGTGGGIVYNSPSCSGPPYIFKFDTVSLPLTLLSESAVDDPGHMLYLEDPAADPIALASFSGSQPQDGACLPAGGGQNPAILIPVQPILDLDTLFTPPFSVR
jgi:hypothetical protein